LESGQERAEIERRKVDLLPKMLVEFQNSRTIFKMPKTQENKIAVVGPRKVGKSGEMKV